jgi:hypothetical protein
MKQYICIDRRKIYSFFTVIMKHTGREKNEEFQTTV